jgi:hypothetical protein
MDLQAINHSLPEEPLFAFVSKSPRLGITHSQSRSFLLDNVIGPMRVILRSHNPFTRTSPRHFIRPISPHFSIFLSHSFLRSFIQANQIAKNGLGTLTTDDIAPLSNYICTVNNLKALNKCITCVDNSGTEGYKNDFFGSQDVETFVNGM